MKPFIDTTLERPLFSMADVESANKEWGANCGPAAIAAVLGLTLNDVRQYLGDFESKHYTNPTLMWQTLDALGVKWSRTTKPAEWPVYGLARIQWEGPWTAPGVPARAAYRQTHWVGVNGRDRENIGIFDVNAVNNGSGWVSLNHWSAILVPWLLENAIPKANGLWHLTHSVEVTD